MQPAVVSLGEVHGGTTSNVIPAQVYLHGTLRSCAAEVREQLITEVERALTVVRSLGGDFRLEVERGYPAGWNDATVNSWLSAVSTDFLGASAINEEPIGMGAEDLAYMSQLAPGAMIMIGAALADGISRGHHTEIFDIDERSLSLGAAILAETALRFLTGEVSL